MLKFIDSVTIAGHKWKVLYPYHFKERTDYNGQADTALLEIRVTDVDECGNVRPDIVIIKTFLHELVHAIDRHYCMWMIGREVDKENLTEGMATGLTQVMMENNPLWVIL